MPQEKQSAQHPEAHKRGSYEGWTPEIKTEADLRAAIEIAFDFRGDVTLKLKDGSALVGYLFNREAEVAEPYLEIYPRNEDAQRRVFYKQIAGLEFSKIDPAAGRSWESWIKKNEEKKKALAEGRDIGDIEPQPMSLEDRD